MRGCYEAKHNENVIEEEKKARSISCVLLCLFSEESAARTIDNNLLMSQLCPITVFYCRLLPLSLSNCLSVYLSVILSLSHSSLGMISVYL